MSSEESVNMKDQMVHIFYEYSQQFLEAMCEVWPECPALKQYKLKFDIACVHPPEAVTLPVKRSMIAKYHAAMSPHYTRCNSKDDTLLMDRSAQEGIAILNDIEFYKKWRPDLHPETKENVWEYINNMNRYSNLHNLYSTVPTGMMGTIENMANGIAHKMSSGEMNMNDLNLQQLGQNVMQSMDHQDLDAFAQNMAGNMGDVQSMYTMLGSMLGSMPGAMPAGMPAPGMPAPGTAAPGTAAAGTAAALAAPEEPSLKNVAIGEVE
jgi:hypothetical protein